MVRIPKNANICATLVSALAVAVTLLASAPVARAAGPRVPERTLEAIGRATVRAAPDTVRVVVAVETRAKTAAAAAEANARVSRRVGDGLERDIADDGEVSTSGYTLRARYEYLKAEQRQQLVGYVATNSVTVTTGRLDQAGPLIDTAVAAGATSVGSITFSLRDDEAVRREAVLEAGRRARARVDAIAEALGVKVGELHSATTVSAPPDAPRPHLARAAMMAESADGGTPIAAGQLAIEMAVHVVFGVR